MMLFKRAWLATALVFVPGLCLFAADPPAHADILKQLAAAKVTNEDYYLRNVSLMTVARTYDDSGTMRDETKFQYIAGKDRFLQRMIENRKMPENTSLPLKDIILGRPEGIFRIAAKGPDQYLLRATLPWTDENVYSFLRGDDGLSLPVADLDLPLVNLLRLPDLTILSQSEATWFGTRLTRVSAYRAFMGGLECNYYFDAAHGWLYYGKEHRSLKTAARSASRVFYQPDGVTPWKLEVQLFPSDKPPYQPYTAEVLEFRKGEHPDREFSLAQFGLPEPVGDASPARRTPVYVWLILTAVAFGALAMLFRAIAKRSSNNETMPS